MAVIKVDDAVSFIGKKGVMQYGIVAQIKEGSVYTVRCLEEKNRHYYLQASELTIIARKGTKRYSMIVEGALPNVKSPAQGANDRSPRVQKIIDRYKENTVADEEVEAFVTEIERMNAENFFTKVIDDALDNNDQASFLYWTEKMKEFKNS